MVQTIKTWEEVEFVAKRKGYNPVYVSLSLNRDTKKYTINTQNQDTVSFNNDSLVESEMKLECLKECIKYIKQVLANQ